MREESWIEIRNKNEKNKHGMREETRSERRNIEGENKH